MGKRAAVATTEEEVARLTLAQLNGQIASAEWRFQMVANSQLRKAAYKRLVWYERLRESLHGIPAPARRPHRRNSD
jgi:hypothetical protein